MKTCTSLIATTPYCCGIASFFFAVDLFFGSLLLSMLVDIVKGEEQQTEEAAEKVYQKEEAYAEKEEDWKEHEGKEQNEEERK
jgi:hypothetical protein